MPAIGGIVHCPVRAAYGRCSWAACRVTVSCRRLITYGSGGIGVRPGMLGAEGYAALIRDELTRWREVIRAGNIRAD